MAKQKWTPSNALALAIAKVEEQAGGELRNWGTNEHLACLRYFIQSFAKDGKIEAAELAAKGSIGKALLDESSFWAFASNAKKMLEEYGSLTAKGGGYE